MATTFLKRHSRIVLTPCPSPTTRSEPAESEILRSQCTQIITRLFPDASKPGACSPTDVDKLIAVFYCDRFAQRANHPRLARSTRLYALDKLATGGATHDYDPQAGLIDMRRYLNLLCEVLRSFNADGTALEHLNMNGWYAGINKFGETCARARRKCPPSLQIELWDVAFRLKHCHYLLFGIEDYSNLGESDIELSKGSEYGNQSTNAKDNLFTLINHQRSREKWHEVYMELEEKCFDALAMGIDEYQTTVLQVVKRIEVDTIVYMRTKLEDELTREGHSTHGRAVRQMFRTITKPYEENAQFFKYGILDLMYHSSFWVHNRAGCFEEMVGAIQLVLHRSHRSATLLHRKAVDLYHWINELGREDCTVYGRLEERNSIEEWISRNKDVEALEDSKR